MPTFDLSLVKKPKIKRKDSFNKTKGKYTVIQRNVKGVCCITLEGFYYVQFGEHLYEFTSSGMGHFASNFERFIVELFPDQYKVSIYYYKDY